MAGKNAVTLTFAGDSRQLEKAFAKVGAASETMGNKVRGTMASIGTLFAAGAALSFAKGAIDSASNLAETQSKVNVLFGEGASKLDAWAGSAAKALGQSKQQALDAAATFGVFGKSAGLTGSGLTDFSMNLTKLASDMASFSNTTPQEAIDALGAALRGEMEPIRKYGVLLDDASLKAQAAAMGMKVVGGVLTPQQKILTAQALILKQTTAAQGDFARTASGAANKTRIQAAEVENLKARIGAGLLPAYSGVLSATMAVVDWGGKHTGMVKALGIAVGVLAGAYAVYVVAQKIQTAVQWAQNAAWLASPITWIILGIVLLVAAIVLIATKTTWFQTIWKVAWTWIKNTAVDVWDWLKALPGKLGSVFKTVADFITAPFRAAFNFIARAWNATIGSLSWTVPGWIPVVGGHSISAPKLPTFHTGGIVPGPAGADVLGILQAGETITPAGSSGAAGTPTLRVVGNGDSALATFLHGLVRRGILQFEMAS